MIIGLDIGGTKLAAARVGPQGHARSVKTLPTPILEGPTAILDAAAGLVKKISGLSEISRLGIGSAGAIDPVNGVVTSATETLPGWNGVHLIEEMSARIENVQRMVVRNDVHAHALGESWVGAAQGTNLAVVVIVGTGVGASVLRAGSIDPGAHHLAGAIAHMPVASAIHPICSCGKPGHLEAVAAGPGLVKQYHGLGGDPRVTKGHEVAIRAGRGERTAGFALDQSAMALGRALVGIVSVVDPEVVIVGGGVTNAGPLWWDRMVTTFESELPPALEGLEVRRAKLGSVGAIIGATCDEV
ncbi:MAG: ROK family protein [Propionibacteriaceae bacterium]|jgi:glucokinase|nr:ROK family protein [Propionibacteriaceae bacterium]